MRTVGPGRSIDNVNWFIDLWTKGKIPGCVTGRAGLPWSLDGDERIARVSDVNDLEKRLAQGCDSSSSGPTRRSDMPELARQRRFSVLGARVSAEWLVMRSARGGGLCRRGVAPAPALVVSRTWLLRAISRLSPDRFQRPAILGDSQS